LLPAAPVFAPAPESIARAITSALGVSGTVLKLANSGTDAFRLDAEPQLFVKLVPASRWPEVQRAESIARWLAARRAPAIAAISVEPPRLPDGAYALAYPFVDGRPPGPADARAVGEALARLHLALASHPDSADWRRRTGERVQRLAGIRGLLSRGALHAGPRPEALRALCADSSIAFIPSSSESSHRPLHGDLNIFNMMVGPSGTVSFLDFEDVSHSVLPPEWDVAAVCERAILVQQADNGAARAAVDALLRGYADAGGAPVDRSALPTVLRGLALRALCTLATIDPGGTDAAEWSKFFGLMEAAAARQAVFD
jgi:Ser/Thr protein kinase RdoA (MazF antagonist)